METIFTIASVLGVFPGRKAYCKSTDLVKRPMMKRSKGRQVSPLSLSYILVMLVPFHTSTEKATKSDWKLF